MQARFFWNRKGLLHWDRVPYAEILLSGTSPRASTADSRNKGESASFDASGG